MSGIQNVFAHPIALSALGLTLGTLVSFTLYANPVRSAELARFASLQPLDPHKLSIFGTIESIDTTTQTIQLKTIDPYDAGSIRISVRYDDRTRLLSHESLIGTRQPKTIQKDALKAPSYANVVLERDTELYANGITLYCGSVNCI